MLICERAFLLITKLFTMTIISRAQAPTPKFFKSLRTIGLVLLAISGSLLASPIAVPAIITTVAGYAAVAGGVLSAVSQVTVESKENNDVSDENRPIP